MGKRRKKTRMSAKHGNALFAAHQFKTRMEQQNCKCFFCCVEITRDNATADHFIPKCRRGDRSWQNIVVSCFRCNNMKGSTIPIIADLSRFRLSFGYWPAMSKSLFGGFAKVSAMNGKDLIGIYSEAEINYAIELSTEFVSVRKTGGLLECSTH